MRSIKFEWDQEKNLKNKKKHNISFEEAITVFYDENAIEFYDDSHSKKEEDRFIMLGFSNRLRLLIVCYCFLNADSTIRIISTRKATKNESKYYGGK